MLTNTIFIGSSDARARMHLDLLHFPLPGMRTAVRGRRRIAIAASFTACGDLPRVSSNPNQSNRFGSRAGGRRERRERLSWNAAEPPRAWSRSPFSGTDWSPPPCKGTRSGQKRTPSNLLVVWTEGLEDGGGNARPPPFLRGGRL